MATQRNITVDQFSTFRMRVLWYDGASVEMLAPKDITNYTALLQVRASMNASPVVSLTQAAGLTLGGVAGTIDILITSVQTAMFNPDEEYEYDLVLTSPSPGLVATRLIQGKVSVSAGVSR